jgi:hypothetical protein
LVWNITCLRLVTAGTTIIVIVIVIITVIRAAIAFSQYFCSYRGPLFLVFLKVWVNRKDIQMFLFLDLFVIQCDLESDLIIAFHYIEFIGNGRKFSKPRLALLEQLLHLVF